jgi:thioesterase domain-containing protein/acyl carrier protein
MVPSAFVCLDALPLSPNGKIDRRALPPPDASTRSATGYAPPRTPDEQVLAGIFAEILRVERVSLDDDFFELGGHSLLATQVTARVRAQLGRDLPLVALFEARTVKGVCEALRTRATYTPLVSLAAEGTRPPLYCVHPLGGTVFCFADLARHLAPSYPLYGLQAPGLTQDAPPRASIEELAALYVEVLRARQPTGPYHLAGYSMGGLIALEMARRLHTGARLAIIDAVPPQPWMRALPEADDAQLLAEALGAPDASSALDKETPGLLPMLRAHQRAMLAYEPAPYAGPLVVLLSDGTLAAGGAEAWRALAPLAKIHPLPGDHNSLLHEPHVAVLAQRLEEWLWQQRA